MLRRRWRLVVLRFSEADAQEESIVHSGSAASISVPGGLNLDKAATPAGLSETGEDGSFVLTYLKRSRVTGL